MRFFTVLFTVEILITVCVSQRRGLVAVFDEDIDTVANVDKKERTTVPTDHLENVGVTHLSETVIPKFRDDVMEKRIPESLLIEMSNIHSADEFVRRFVEPDIDDYPDDMTGFLETSRPGHNRKGLSGGDSIGVTAFAGCSPQKQIVRVTNSESEKVILWPPCVSLPRCGGCCTSELMICRPTATSEVNVTVLQARYTGAQSNPLASEGVRVLTMEQHDSCFCGCKELPEHCTPLQEYREGECRCVCAKQNEATRCQQQARKFWDSRDCLCKCRTTNDCSSGYYFNPKTCRCEIIRISLSDLPDTPFPNKNETAEISRANENSPFYEDNE